MASPPDAKGSREGEDRRGSNDVDGPELGYPLVERRRADRATTWDGIERRTGPALPKAPAAAPAPPVAPFRWAALLIGFVLGREELAQPDGWVIAAGLALVAITVWRTLQPVPLEGTSSARWLFVDAVLATVVVLVSGAWASPWVLALVPPTIAAGFAKGSVYAVEQCAAVVVAVSIGWFVGADDVGEHFDLALLLAALLVGTAVVSGMVRKVSRESAQAQSLALGQVGRLTEANGLLVSLHRVAQTLPASLDLDDVLDSTIGRLRDLMAFDSVTIFLYEEGDEPGCRSAGRATASRPPSRRARFPPPLVLATTDQGTVVKNDLAADGGPGVSPRAASGLYAALRARGALVGLIAVESGTPERFSAREIGLLNGLVEPLGVAIDNARLFGRLRTIGADEERNRIARDLHDRLGQSIAYLAFELDRVVRVAERGERRPPAARDVAGGGAQRAAHAAGDAVRPPHRRPRRPGPGRDDGALPRPCARAQRARASTSSSTRRGTAAAAAGEGALAHRQGGRDQRRAPRPGQAARHPRGGATAGPPSWSCATTAWASPRAPVAIDSYGILGMRERAASLGAWFDIESAPGAGHHHPVSLAPN